MLIAALAVSALFCPAANAESQVFRCVDGQGHVVFSDTSCGAAAEEVEIVESSGGLSPIEGDGLSPQERGLLGASEARNSRATNQRAQAGAHKESKFAPVTTPPPKVPRHY